MEAVSALKALVQGKDSLGLAGFYFQPLSLGGLVSNLGEAVSTNNLEAKDDGFMRLFQHAKKHPETTARYRKHRKLGSYRKPF